MANHYAREQTTARIFSKPKRKPYLAEHVAGWQRHVWQGARVPGSQHDTTVRRVGFYFVDALGQLVHPLPAVVCVHAAVGGPKVAPLEAVHRPQVPLLPAAQHMAVIDVAAMCSINLLVRER